MSTMLIYGRHGFGDCIYQRPIVKALAQNHARTFLVTAFPWLYYDMDLKFQRDNAQLSANLTEMESCKEQQWSVIPRGPVVYETYTTYTPSSVLLRGSISNAMAYQAGVFLREPLELDVPEEWKEAAYNLLEKAGVVGPFVLVRPVTNRLEWMCKSRNPECGALSKAVKLLRNEVGCTIEIGLLNDQEEVVESPKTDISWMRGELGLKESFGLLSMATCVVGPPGWIVPACYAVGTPLLCVCGGYLPGRCMSPSNVVPYDPVVFCEPTPFCACGNRYHDCRKSLTDKEIHDSVQRIITRIS